ncbi:MAG: hypothetical protein ABL908_21990 [Hyphomicrobium sp.]
MSVTDKPRHYDVAVRASILTVQVMSDDRIAADLREQADELEAAGRTYWPALLREAARRLTEPCPMPLPPELAAQVDAIRRAAQRVKPRELIEEILAKPVEP